MAQQEPADTVHGAGFGTTEEPGEAGIPFAGDEGSAPPAAAPAWPWLEDADLTYGIAACAVAVILALYLLYRSQQEADARRKAASYDRLAALAAARAKAADSKQAEVRRKAAEAREAQAAAAAAARAEAKAKVQADRILAEEVGVTNAAGDVIGRRLGQGQGAGQASISAETRAPRQSAAQAAVASRAAERQEIRAAYEAAVTKDTVRAIDDAEMREAVAASLATQAAEQAREAEASAAVLRSAQDAVAALGMKVTCIPPTAARGEVPDPPEVPQGLVVVRLASVASSGLRHVKVQYPLGSTSVKALLQALEVVVPGGVKGRVLMSSHPRAVVGDGDALHAGSADAALESSVEEAGVAPRSALLLRLKADA